MNPFDEYDDDKRILKLSAELLVLVVRRERISGNEEPLSEALSESLAKMLRPRSLNFFHPPVGTFFSGGVTWIDPSHAASQTDLS